ncbi:hypothetical protein GLV94_01120 [Virgibacillus halodenitrificans]|uniref:TcaA second domain-containing protein n=1 Tax=Virgibacillus halodenitrificans TaxID=1482 RepID=UPI001368E3AE|nr:hypothetical protein [Virgibacillus halodenitrificans]MYL44235.1 hypothetical protein [Virgibacillus halodenitrificans]
MSKKTMIIFGLAGLVVVLLISFFILQQNHKPDKVVQQFKDAVKQKDTETLKELIIPDNKKAAVEKGTLTALITYLNENHNSFEVIKDGLNKQIKDKSFGTSNEQISLIETGKDMGIFPVYKLEAKTVNIKVSGQNEDDDIALEVNGLKKSLSKTDEKEEKYGPLLPGQYELEASVKNQLGMFKHKEKADVWGNKQVTVLVEPEKLVQENKKINEDIMNTTVKFNENLSVFMTSGLNAKSFTHSTEQFKKDFAGSEDYFELVKTGIDEIQSQYLSAVVNESAMDINYFDGQWTAEVEAVVDYNEKVKIKGTKKFEDASYQALRKYSLEYNKDKKKWLIQSIEDIMADGTEPDYWDKKKELKVSNPPVNTWNAKSTSI